MKRIIKIAVLICLAYLTFHIVQMQENTEFEIIITDEIPKGKQSTYTWIKNAEANKSIRQCYVGGNKEGNKKEETTVSSTNISDKLDEKKSYNEITEGDVITGDLTHYDVCIYCCGKTDGITASGLVIKNGVEPEIPVVSCNWLPFGSLIEIEDITYVVADRGGKGLNKVGRVDIFTPEGHQAALELGRKKGIAIQIISTLRIQKREKKHENPWGWVAGVARFSLP